MKMEINTEVCNCIFDKDVYILDKQQRPKPKTATIRSIHENQQDVVKTQKIEIKEEEEEEEDAMMKMMGFTGFTTTHVSLLSFPQHS